MSSLVKSDVSESPVKSDVSESPVKSDVSESPVKSDVYGSPYINTKLFTTVSLKADQLNNKFYINLKKNLEEQILHKCYKNYGYIMDIYKIIKYSDGNIEPENYSASAKYDIEFSCRLCRPLRLRQIICEIDRVNKVLVTTTNGPIIVIITNDRINDKVFFTDNNNNLRYKKDGKTQLLKKGDFVKISLKATMFNHADTKIKAIGYLEEVATDDDVKEYYKDIYDKEKEMIDIEKYIED